MENKVEGYEAYVKKNKNNTSSITLKISGANCAACIQKIESMLHAIDSVSYARLNFTSGTLRIEFESDDIAVNNFVEKIQSLGYQVHPFNFSSDNNDIAKKLLLYVGVSGFAAGNIMLLSFGLWITNSETMGAGIREFLHWISALISIPAVLFAGQPFFKSAWSVLKNKKTNMDVPISLALILTLIMSTHELLRQAEHVYFDSALMLCFFLLIGRYLDFKAKQNARSAATDLMNTLSGFATILEDNITKKIPIRDIKENMIVLVSVGETIPVDGNIMRGQSQIDTSLVTGETLPRAANIGDDVFAGTLNLDSPLTIKTSKATDDTLLSQIVKLMDNAAQNQTAYTRLADRAAKLYTPMVHSLAFLAFVLWWTFIGAQWQDSLIIATTVLIITCPCALGLAVPVAQVLATGELLKNNIIVKSGDALERLASIDTIFLDKTGTLTQGKPILVGDYPNDLLQLAASLAQHSKHPLSQALTNSYHGKLLDIDDLEEHPGQGVSGKWNKKNVKIGSRSYCGQDDADIHNGPELWLKIDRTPPTQFKFSDQLREDTVQIINDFKNHNLKLRLLSGDRKNVVDDIAQKLSLDISYSELTPTQKFDHLNAVQENNAHVLMIGDGLNDAPVLAGADVSIAPGTAVDMAQNAADIIFMGEKFEPVKTAYLMALKTQKIIKQNFALAVLYNMVAIPIAFMGFVTPMIAAIAMSGSSIIVILNSFRLKLKLS